MFRGIEEEHSTSRFTLVNVALGILLIGIAGFVWLALMSLRIYRPTDTEERLFKELTAPNYVDHILADLANLRSQMQSNPAGTRELDQGKILKLSIGLLRVIDANPELPKAWQAAGSIITFRTASNVLEDSEICGKVGMTRTGDSDFVSGNSDLLPEFRNCTIALDDAPQIVRANPLFSRHRMSQYANGVRRPMLRLRNVHVIYRGGELLPVDAIACIDCKFEFDLHSAPPRRGRSLMRVLLEANDITNAGVELSDDMKPANKASSDVTQK
jgi:hypothetical protein